jgi:hypothetical protein
VKKLLLDNGSDVSVFPFYLYLSTYNQLLYKYSYNCDTSSWEVQYYMNGTLGMSQEGATDESVVKKMKDEYAALANTCHHCGARDVKTLRCSRCKIVRYCGVQCQKEDYPVHKLRCKMIAERGINLFDSEPVVQVYK